MDKAQISLNWSSDARITSVVLGEMEKGLFLYSSSDAEDLLKSAKLAMSGGTCSCGGKYSVEKKGEGFVEKNSGVEFTMFNCYQVQTLLKG